MSQQNEVKAREAVVLFPTGKPFFSEEVDMIEKSFYDSLKEELELSKAANISLAEEMQDLAISSTKTVAQAMAKLNEVQAENARLCVALKDQGKLVQSLSDFNVKATEENAKLREALTKEKLLEIIDEWQMIWRNQNINPDDTRRYRRRALSVDANMRGSLARMISEKALAGGQDGKR